jgi:hypothetical protein
MGQSDPQSFARHTYSTMTEGDSSIRAKDSNIAFEAADDFSHWDDNLRIGSVVSLPVRLQIAVICCTATRASKNKSDAASSSMPCEARSARIEMAEDGMVAFRS